MERPRCALHRYKTIFYTKEDALDYATSKYSEIKWEAYYCPNITEHVHLRRVTKKSRDHRRSPEAINRRREKRNKRRKHR